MEERYSIALAIAFFLNLEVLFALAHKVDKNCFTAFRPHFSSLSHSNLQILVFLAFSLYAISFLPTIIDNIMLRIKYRKRNKCYLNLKPILIVCTIFFVGNSFAYWSLPSFPEKFIIGIMFFSCPLLSFLYSPTLYLNNNSIIALYGISFLEIKYHSLKLNDEMLFIYEDEDSPDSIVACKISNIRADKDFFDELKSRIDN